MQGMSERHFWTPAVASHRRVGDLAKVGTQDKIKHPATRGHGPHSTAGVGMREARGDQTGPAVDGSEMQFLRGLLPLLASAEGWVCGGKVGLPWSNSRGIAC